MDKASSSPSSGRPVRVKKVGNYLIGKTLGQGTFGKVKLGTHVLTGSKAALKILEKDRIVDVADMQRITREIHILKLLNHDNVVRLFEVIDTPKHIYLIIEHVSGGELFDYIVARKRVREKEACRFFHQIISGLDYCHKRCVIHRDLKPENLLLDEHKNIKIIDFGLSNMIKRGSYLKTACGSPCLTADALISFTDGTCHSIKDILAFHEAGQVAFPLVTFDSEVGQVVPTLSNSIVAQGVKDIVKLTFGDGREIRCTPNHTFLTITEASSAPVWVAASEMTPAHRILAGIQGAEDVIGDDEKDYVLLLKDSENMASITQDIISTSGGSASMSSSRETLIAFASLAGALLANGCIDANGQGHFIVQHEQDMVTLIDDIERVIGRRPTYGAVDEGDGKQVSCPRELTALFLAQNIRKGGRLDVGIRHPTFVQDPACPKAILAAYLSGLFGGQGVRPTYDASKACFTFLCPTTRTDPDMSADMQSFMDGTADIIKRLFDLETLDSCVKVQAPRPSKAELEAPSTEDHHHTYTLQILAGLPQFLERVHYRYAVDKEYYAELTRCYRRYVNTAGNGAIMSPTDFFKNVLHADLTSPAFPHSPARVYQPFSIPFVARVDAGKEAVYDIGVPETHNFMANGLVVHNCYAAPEMILGREYDGAAADLWSTGVLLFALVCGYLPFEDQNTKALYDKITHGRYKLPSFLSPDCKEMIKALLTVNPAKRVTILKIRDMAWWKLHEDAVPETPLEAPADGDAPIDMDVVQQLAQFSFDPEYAVRCLRGNKHNQITATYYLLKEKLRREKLARAVDEAPKSLKSPSKKPAPGLPEIGENDEYDAIKDKLGATVPTDKPSTERQADVFSKPKPSRARRHSMAVPDPSKMAELAKKTVDADTGKDKTGRRTRRMSVSQATEQRAYKPPADRDVESYNGAFNVETTSGMTPKQILSEVKDVLKRNSVRMKQTKPYALKCEEPNTAIRFEVEVCKLDKFEQLYVVHFKRLIGDTWVYKNVCQNLAGMMKL